MDVEQRSPPPPPDGLFCYKIRSCTFAYETFCQVKFCNPRYNNNKSSNTDVGSLHSRGFSYLPAPFWLKAEPTDWLPTEDSDPFTC